MKYLKIIMVWVAYTIRIASKLKKERELNLLFHKINIS